MLHNCYAGVVCVVFAMLTGCAPSYKTLSVYLEGEGGKQAGVHRTVTVAGAPVAVWATNPTAPVFITSSTTQAAVRIYIEGDGSAFTPNGYPSGNPTPKYPVALQLMQADASGSELYYIGRPCQWVPLPHKGCSPEVWTKGRFTPEVLESYTALIRELSANRPTELIGYSGGAWLAVQVGARLPNITGVRSVAGSLDPNATNRYHHVPAIPVATAVTPSALQPLLIYRGGEDRVIPLALAEAQTQGRPCKAMVTLYSASHTHGWAEAWPKLGVLPYPACGVASGPPPRQPEIFR